jgi:hypothetical protein
MRVVGEIPHPDCKITIFSWNNRYLIKFENGLLEQTFKVAEYDILQESDLYALVSEDFIQETLARFTAMNQSFRARLHAIG